MMSKRVFAKKMINFTDFRCSARYVMGVDVLSLDPLLCPQNLDLCLVSCAIYALYPCWTTVVGCTMTNKFGPAFLRSQLAMQQLDQISLRFEQVNRCMPRLFLQLETESSLEYRFDVINVMIFGHPQAPPKMVLLDFLFLAFLP